MPENSRITINCLDHVAIYVDDIQASIKWYEDVLGLTKCQVPEWGESPIFLLAGKTGVALFQKDISDSNQLKNAELKFIDHYAFNVSNEDFNKAQKLYAHLDLKFTIKDHHYFHSIYTKDPDGHTVELTTLVVDEKDFYQI